MPIPKRYFHVSQEINLDPEVWTFTEQFGDRAIRTWLQILAYLDRSENQWRLTEGSFETLGRTVRQYAKTVRRQVEELVKNGWLVVLESDKNGSPTILSARNWSKYNRTKEHSGNTNGSFATPLRSVPTPSRSVPTPKTEELREERKEKKTDAASPSALFRLEAFALDEEFEAWARREAIPNPGVYLEEFKDYWRSVGGKRANGRPITNWEATFKNRLRTLRDTGKLKTSSVWEA